MNCNSVIFLTKNKIPETKLSVSPTTPDVFLIFSEERLDLESCFVILAEHLHIIQHELEMTKFLALTLSCVQGPQQMLLYIID